jgi:hypothetical protein
MLQLKPLQLCKTLLLPAFACDPGPVAPLPANCSTRLRGFQVSMERNATLPALTAGAAAVSVRQYGHSVGSYRRLTGSIFSNVPSQWLQWMSYSGIVVLIRK